MPIACREWTIFVPTLVLIAQAIFFLECRQTDTQTHNATDHPIYDSTTASIGNKNSWW